MGCQRLLGAKLRDVGGVLMLRQEKNQTTLDICAPIIQSEDCKGLKNHAANLKRHESWMGNGGLSLLHLADRYNQVEMP